MEFEDVSEEVEWEMRRVATAFGVEEFSHRLSVDEFDCRATSGQLRFWWRIPSDGGHVRQIDVGGWRPTCMVVLKEGRIVECSPHYSDPECNERMARGLYRLGIEEETALASLPRLSAHEKLELRLSLPREFWPQKWIDEGG